MVENNTGAKAALNSYITQVTYLGHQLIRYFIIGEECILSLEYFGDVGKEFENNQKQIEELKNTNSTKKNPLADKSVDLWKTLYNFTNFFYTNKNENIEKYSFLLFVSSPRELKMNFAKEFNNCKTDRDINNIEKIITKEFGIKSVGRKLIKSMESISEDKNVTNYVNHLFSKEHYNTFKEVLKRFEIIQGELDYSIATKKIFQKNYCLSDDKVHEIFESYQGWIFEKVRTCILEGKLIRIHTESFQEFLSENLEKVMEKEKFEISERVHKQNIQIEVENELEIYPQYLKQMSLISLSKSKIKQAATDFIFHDLVKQDWSESGIVTSKNDPKINRYMKELFLLWEGQKDMINITEKTLNEIDRGSLLFLKTIEMHDKINIDNNTTVIPQLFRGFIHELSNLNFTNDLSIGWHPDYTKLLKDGESDD